MISSKYHFNNVRTLTRNLLQPVMSSTQRMTKSLLVHIRESIAQDDSRFCINKDGLFPVHLDISEHQDKLFFITGYPFKT
jgi:hypothetical protein